MNLQKLRPQQKLVDVNNRLGNNFLKTMQGTTKMVYDTLEVSPGQNVYQFFKDTNARTFPFCNVKNDSLPVAESLSVQRISLSVLEETVDLVTGITYKVSPIVGLISNLEVSDLSLKIANDVVMKPITVQHFLAAYNKNATNEELEIFEMNTDMVIPPQLDFSFDLRVFNLINTGENKVYLRLIVEGVGAQFNGKTNF
jgi:hypothetical protein